MSGIILIRERRYHHSQRLRGIPGGVCLTMDVAGLPEIAAWAAGFGGHARVVEPPELVDRVRQPFPAISAGLH